MKIEIDLRVNESVELLKALAQEVTVESDINEEIKVLDEVLWTKTPMK